MSLTRDNKTNPLLGEYNADFAAKIRDNLGGVNGLWPIELGGTGASDAAAALEALGLPYEVGVWNPDIGGETTTGSYTYTRRSGWYVKIGSLVFVMADIIVSDVITQGDGLAVIMSMPYSSMGGRPGALYAVTLGGARVQAFLEPSGNNIYIRSFDTMNFINASEIRANDAIPGAFFWYRTT